jgi:ABC-type spermidine/putrescine transport system permease subunit II
MIDLFKNAASAVENSILACSIVIAMFTILLAYLTWLILRTEKKTKRRK